MAVLPLVTMDDPVLHQKAKRVRKIDASIQKLIDDMIETMHDIGGAAGLAAPQCGIPLQVVVIEMPESDEIIALINPEIVKTSGERTVMEGCLSLPGYRGTLKRAETVTVKGRDRNGKEIRIKGDGLLGHALQHETDHINGIVYVDRLESRDHLQKISPEEEDEAGEM